MWRRVRSESLLPHRDSSLSVGSRILVAVVGLAFLVAFETGSAAPDRAVLGLTGTAAPGPVISVKFSSSQESTSSVGDPPVKAMVRPVETDGALVVVSRSNQTITLFARDGSFAGTHACATGVYYPLPGRYRVIDRRPASSSPWDGTRFAHFTVFARSHRGTAIGFHSIPVNSRGEPVAGLGSPNSHGCVRLEADVAEFLYQWLDQDSLVLVTP